MHAVIVADTRPEHPCEEAHLPNQPRLALLNHAQLRMLYCYPSPWRLFLIDEATGARELLGSWDQSPENDEVEKVVFDKKGKPNPAERVQASAKFFQDGM